MNTPSISVVMINYNAGRLLPLAIESVLNQSDGDFELIVVDDASKDDGPDVIRRYAGMDRRVRPVLNTDNGGISATRNIGIELATGRYVALLDGDDCFTPNCLERQKEHFLRLQKSYSNLCMLASDAWLINENGARCGRYLSSDLWGGDHVEDCPFWTLPSTWMFPREVPVRFHAPYRFADAPMFINRMRAYGQIACVGEPLVEYRLRISSATNALAARVVRDMNAASQTASEGRLDNPVDSATIPAPSWNQVAAWKHGRNAKAAMVNGKPLRAARDLCIAAIADPGKTLGKINRFIGQKLHR